MAIKVFEYDVSWFSDSQKCMVHKEFLATDISSLIEKIERVFTNNELRNVSSIKKKRRVLKRQLTYLQKKEFFNT